MKSLQAFLGHLKPGQVYRRTDLLQWSNAIDRHLAMLVQEGVLQKLAGGLYYYPSEGVFGKLPPAEDKLVRSFLNDSHFLLTNLNDYNVLGVGTTQLYNKTIVYNHKRHGEFKFGNRSLTFVIRHRFPKTKNVEFLLVDLLNNLDELAEDKAEVLRRVREKVKSMNVTKLKKALSQYGNKSAQKQLAHLLLSQTSLHA